MRRSLGVRPVAGLAVLVLTVLVFPAPARAQEARGYVGAGAAITPFRPASVSSSASLSYENATDDDWAAAITLEGGAFLGQWVGLGVEVALPARRDMEQRYYYTAPYLAEIRYREAPLFGVVRWHPLGSPSGLAFVAGAGLVRQSAIQRRASRIGFSGSQYGPLGPEVRVSRWTWGATAGIDAAVPLGPRFSLVPHVRAVFVERGETYDSDQFADLGLPSVTWRAGLVLRALF